MTIEQVDTISAYTVEVGDTIFLNGAEAFITRINDKGAFIEFDYTDEYENNYESVEVGADVLVSLLADVPDPDEDI